MTRTYIGIFGLFMLAPLAVFAMFACPAEPSCPEQSECSTISVGTIEQVRGDTLIIISGVGLALRLDTVVVRPGLIVRINDCGQ